MSDSPQPRLRELERRRRLVLAQLESEQPALMRELDLLNQLIGIYSKPATKPGEDWSWVQSPAQAVELCLIEAGRPMNKGEIFGRLEAVGFIGSNKEKWTVNDTINYRVRTGALVRVGDGEKLEMTISLPSPIKTQ